MERPTDAELKKKMEDCKEDQQCFLRTVAAFRAYAVNASAGLEWRRSQFNKMTDEHKKLLSFDAEERIFKQHEAAIANNKVFLDTISEESSQLFESYWDFGAVVDGPDKAPTSMDMDKVYSTMRQVVRDYADEGKGERDAVYGPFIRKLENMFPDREKRVGVRILCPGSGLNRLPLDLATSGFSAQGNEFSYHMLIVGHYLMNHTEQKFQHTFYPYCDNTCNLWTRADQFRPIRTPDVCASDIISELEEQNLSFGQLSMIAGDFIEVYAKPDQVGCWDIVATCFFIDTAHNIVEYLQVIYNCLPPGGLWMNLGPLLYHFADDYSTNPRDTSNGINSIELSLDEVLQVAKNIGFNLIEQHPVDCTYTNNFSSMKQMVYRCTFFMMQKPLQKQQQQPPPPAYKQGEQNKSDAGSAETGKKEEGGKKE